MAVAIPQGENSAALADWVETMLANGDANAINFVRIARLLKGEATELAELELREDGEEAESDLDLTMLGTEGEAERDQRLDLLKQEVERRARAGEKIYPFRIEEERAVKVDVCGEAVYMLLLVLSSPSAPYRAAREAHKAEPAFDRIALAAMKKYLGREADGVRFARSSSEKDGEGTRPKLFSEAVEWLRDHLEARSGLVEPDDEDGETPHWEWEGENPAPVLNTYKDAGVDLVVWSDFGDDRAGFPVLLVQCTVQLTWENKLEEIPLKLWERWINFSMVPPQTALVIPFSEDPQSDHWEDRCLRAGVVIDRVRLLVLLNELECDELEELILPDEIQWARAELAAI